MANSPSFSTTRKLSLSLNVALSLVAILALVLMVNYLSARHFQRFSISKHAPIKLSPFTLRVLSSITNEIKIIIYFDSKDPLYDPTKALLKEYCFANRLLSLETVDYLRDVPAANMVKAKYKLNSVAEKNLIIFDNNGRPPRIVYDSELSELDLKPLMSGQSREVKRTHFKGELMFTSAFLGIVNPKPLKAYFLQGHGEHQPDGDDALMGYSKFASVLRENSLQWAPLTLLGSSEIPSDCNLLIIPGPTDPLLNEELEKIDRYLKQGGRMLALFKPAVYTPSRQVGLEKILANWGVGVGNDVVLDRKSSVSSEQDILVRAFGNHPLVKPLIHSGLHLILPRSVSKLPGSSSADAPRVEVLAATSPEGHVKTDLRKNGEAYASPDDYRGQVSLMVAVEKGAIRGVLPDRGSTRMVVVGESIFLGNQMIDSAANREFVTHALNWLLARDELLAPLSPTPIKEYKLVMTTSQVKAVSWLLMLGLPGSVLLLGLIVTMVRRK